MEKRLIVAIALSMLVLLSWSTFVSKTYHLDNKQVVGIPSKPAQITTLQPKETVVSGKPAIQPAAALLPFLQNDVEMLFNEAEGSIQEVIFKKYQGYKFTLGHGFLSGGTGVIFKKIHTIDPREIVFQASDPKQQIIKRFYLPNPNSSYNIELGLEIRNLSPAPFTVDVPLVLGMLNFTGDRNRAGFLDIVVAEKDKITHLNGRKALILERVQFLGLRDRYFCAILEPVTDSYNQGFIRKLDAQESEIGLSSSGQLLASGESITYKFHIYLGPQELSIMNSIKPSWSAVIHYGAFDPISHILLQVLGFFHHWLHNWGLAIILLSIGVYFLLYPLTLKQMRSMKAMQVLQPRIEQLRQSYKDNPQKLNKEIIELYREHKVNPMGGCLPLILQIPIFFALYQALMRFVALKGAHFLWIKDLSEPDRLFTLPVSLPVIGNAFNILPILMAIGMVAQQKFSMASASSGSAEQQKLMMIIFPVMFGFIFYNMASALVLYWFINSMLMLISQLRTMRAK